ncbi:DUF3016 domain-containing protein [Paraglaciecola aquimarina]|uniref:DUF3016 domain-containing protein n=1 Tax=Paraglaciecola aquimarina TaxID=1235557 RepID=A0ABU3SVE1_9ALTE|nr:DUF3016 domain-containing protein [Paraglaciecola aquimarina]MDU0353892.1 DUF3016 domain-containing protein [Paraglaciecola aquimarina]
MKFTLFIAYCIALAFAPKALAQSDVEVNWDNPAEYRDVRPANGSKQKFMQSTFTNIDKYIVKLAKALPKDHKLVLTVNDLDLAGQVWPASFAGIGRSMSEIRVVKSVDIPSMAFSYQLLDQDGAVVQQAEVKLKDMLFMQRAHSRFHNDSLRYEKNMLKQWFDQEFKPLLGQVSAG